jgi:DNA end-binding protein Ku
MAERLVEGMVDAWDPDKYRDDYYKDLMKMIHERAEAGQLDEAPEAPPAPKADRGGNVVDLMALLKQSVEGGGRKPAKKAPAKKAPAKKSAKKPAARKPGAKRTASKRKTA